MARWDLVASTKSKALELAISVVAMTPTVKTLAITLRQASNEHLAALYNALCGFGTVSPLNSGYKWALECGLIDEAGVPLAKDVLIDAMSIEVVRRIEAGEFG